MMKEKKIFAETLNEKHNNCLYDDYDNYDFKSLDFDGTYIQSEFRNCDFRSIGAKESYLYRCNFIDCNLDYSFWKDCHFDEVKFVRCSLNNAVFDGTNPGLGDAVFIDCEFFATRGLSSNKKEKKDQIATAKVWPTLKHYISPTFKVEVAKFEDYDDDPYDDYAVFWYVEQAKAAVTEEEDGYGKTAVLQCPDLKVYNDILDYK